MPEIGAFAAPDGAASGADPGNAQVMRHIRRARSYPPGARIEHIASQAHVIIGHKLCIAVFEHQRLGQCRPMQPIRRDGPADAKDQLHVGAIHARFPRFGPAPTIGVELLSRDLFEVHPFVTLASGSVRVTEHRAAGRIEQVVGALPGEIHLAERGSAPIQAVRRFQVAKTRAALGGTGRAPTPVEAPFVEQRAQAQPFVFPRLRRHGNWPQAFSRLRHEADAIGDILPPKRGFPGALVARHGDVATLRIVPAEGTRADIVPGREDEALARQRIRFAGRLMAHHRPAPGLWSARRSAARCGVGVPRWQRPGQTLTPRTRCMRR
jgi:hypothetical protein